MIELNNISKTYLMGNEKINALDDISLKINAGEFVAIMGPSGSGKSTLMHILGFLDRPERGEYLFNNKSISRFKDDQLALLRNHTVGFVFQQFHLLPRLTSVENVALPLLYAGKQKLKQKAYEKINNVGLESRASHLPNELSGGERQRMAIARALVNDPLIILADEPTGNLDSKSENEIMLLLKKLNEEGKTIIIVTHEMKVAKSAHRIIAMQDGRIISDAKKESDILRSASKIDPDYPMGRIELLGHIQQSLKAIFSHKIRSLLSMLGVLIGTAAVITMLALGQGARDAITQRMASLGSNLLSVISGSDKKGDSSSLNFYTNFTFQDAEALRQLPEVKNVSETVYSREEVVFNDKNWNTQLEGVGVAYPQIYSITCAQGRFFTNEELQNRSKVVLLGKTVSENIFGNINPVGKIVKINRSNFQVIGVLPAQGAINSYDQDDIIIAPVTTVMYRILGYDTLESLDVQVTDPAKMDLTSLVIKELIMKRHHLTNDQRIGFRISNLAQIKEVMASTTQTMNLFLGAIAAISLLVGGIGIMNIMLVSVTERTREIGLRKAIGARKSDISLQFLIESILMTFSGGVIGVIVGIIAALVLSQHAGWSVKITMSSVIMATAFSVMIGIIFGLRPAMQAAELNPIEALRYE
jgi:macrolide transport system ATP-binding/permease protein